MCMDVFRRIEPTRPNAIDLDPTPAIGCGEILVAWHHSPDAPVRYTVVVAESDAVLVDSRLPLLHGLSGRILKQLPGGLGVNRSCQVQWCRRRGGSAATYEIRLLID